jgi:hypothetical protein
LPRKQYSKFLKKSEKQKRAFLASKGFLKKHKNCLRNIFLIQINDLKESNQECGSSVEETGKFSGFLSKFGWF